MDVLHHLAGGVAAALTPTNLFMAFVGSLLGTLVGVLPGLGPTAAIAILFPLTSVLNPAAAIIMLAGIYYGAMYGGSTTAILLNIPGEVASVLADQALRFAPPEYFGLMVLAFTVVVSLSGASLARGLAMAMGGYLLALIGLG